MTAAYALVTLGMCVVVVLALVGLVVITGTAVLALLDQHHARSARVAAMTGARLRPTLRLTRSTRG